MSPKLNHKKILGTNMQPSYEEPYVEGPDFAQADKPTYDYRTMENAGQYRGVGTPGKTASKKTDTHKDAMPMQPIYSKVKRDHKG
jgi:hypothetical protein